ncbi:sigma-70 family RNA polymerase sigma factor [Rhodococcus sp. BP-252]|uniref:sigma-70 family RNA polymerase sigma factor n=1 Tax=unclassified Rhodococcus (in: high G+C Gram-positive bacteria) TaxID=192944 RepID=UPI001C9BBC46|nr:MULTISPECIES: sigma-70 family RNA polymerase sigma factor [unclassified Rhodococcus (in: high G+C Gram-positive bacteria)]MBY6413934.1 sigma-70 family RNA polymerase sigma factor [Rhodococcus sp. BP-320]MBY6418616.1 sigma-70 family RNA polymerase sigma factor [Rhodococcus sp. BP-321]MBY6422911.1 sigma-70 family RNA polymerase sigma factor [Rhodococcus sp. BP-324]MBY6428740.1 sigma-70 family RNA polymerase sigma factor [Rhodococcus sp. BP-323]MBY6433737.1 sigma-70 family RNA polymerase sigma
MSVSPPDWAALYLKYRDSMYRVAVSVLRPFGREVEAEDVVMSAMESLMKSPPSNVQTWEALMISTTKRRALDHVRSAAVRHGSPLTPEDQLEQADSVDVATSVAEFVDLQRSGALLWDKLSLLSEQERKVAWEYIALQRPRERLAAELEVSPARISQIAKKVTTKLREALDEDGDRSER